MPECSGAGCQCPNCQCQELTRREREICHFLASGIPQARVAQQLSITVGTLRHHERHIRQKIGVTTRTVAAVHLRVLGFG
jgi:two-component system, NarL family, nitrate/nitrite response regulator NarL